MEGSNTLAFLNSKLKKRKTPYGLCDDSLCRLIWTFIGSLKRMKDLFK